MNKEHNLTNEQFVSLAVHSAQYKREILGKVLGRIIETKEDIPATQLVIASEIASKLAATDTQISVEATPVFELIDAAVLAEKVTVEENSNVHPGARLAGLLQDHFIIESKKKRKAIEESIAEVIIPILSLKPDELAFLSISTEVVLPTDGEVTSEVEADEETSESTGFELPGLLGLRLLVIVLKCQIRFKQGGSGMHFLPNSQEEIGKFILSIKAALQKTDNSGLRHGLELVKTVLEKQLDDLGEAYPVAASMFEQLHLNRLTTVIDPVIAYGKEALKGTQVQQAHTWSVDEFEAGPFLLDALELGVFMNEEVAKRRLELKKNSEEIIKKHALRSAGVGVVPIPIVDLIGASVVSRAMVKELSKLYEIPFDEVRVNSLIRKLIWEVGGVAVGGTVLGSLGKLVPGIGSLLGMTASSLTFGAITYAIGGVFSEHFAEGVGFKDLNPEKVSDKVKELYREGLDLIKKYKDEK